MGILSVFNREVAIDLGTSNTRVMYNGQMVEEPSCVFYDCDNQRVLAVGDGAVRAEWDPGRSKVKLEKVWPLAVSTIADYEASSLLIRWLLAEAGIKGSVFSSVKRMVVSMRADSGGIERRAIKEAAMQAGAKNVKLITSSMAAALGMGLNVMLPEGRMIVDIGGGTSEITVISCGGIVNTACIRVSGREFNDDIAEYMANQHNVEIGRMYMAEKIKIAVGSAINELEEEPKYFCALGRNIRTGEPMEVGVNYKEVAAAIDSSLGKIEQAILLVLKDIPANLADDIRKEGIHLVGGGALLRGIDKRISTKTGLSVRVADDPLRAVSRGTVIALKNFYNSSFLIDE